MLLLTLTVPFGAVVELSISGEMPETHLPRDLTEPPVSPKVVSLLLSPFTNRPPVWVLTRGRPNNPLTPPKTSDSVEALTLGGGSSWVARLATSQSHWVPFVAGSEKLIKIRLLLERVEKTNKHLDVS